MERAGHLRGGQGARLQARECAHGSGQLVTARVRPPVLQSAGGRAGMSMGCPPLLARRSCPTLAGGGKFSAKSNSRW